MEIKKEYETKGNDMQYKSLTVSIKATDDEKGIVEAIVSCFGNVDSYGEIVDKGAFVESLQRKFPKGVWMHDWTIPVSKTLEAKETDAGLYIKGQFNLDTQRGREAYSDLKFGTVDEFSIGYSVEEDYLGEDGFRHLKRLKLYEWSPVLVGANPATQVLGVKSSKKDVDEEQPEPEPEVVPEPTPEITPEATDAPENEETTLEATTTPEITPEGENEDFPAPLEAEKTAGNMETDADLKEGRAISEANRALISEVVDRMGELKGAIKNAITPLKALLDATAKGEEKVEAETLSVDQKTVIKLRQSAKQADKALEYILRVTRDK